jgi:hypothetical protein
VLSQGFGRGGILSEPVVGSNLPQARLWPLSASFSINRRKILRSDKVIG